MYEPASLGMFQCRLQRILCDFEVIMFFRKDPLRQKEGVTRIRLSKRGRIACPLLRVWAGARLPRRQGLRPARCALRLGAILESVFTKFDVRVGGSLRTVLSCTTYGP